MGAGEGGQATALVVDAEVTSYLMMGALSPGLKRHSVTLFEGAHLLSPMCWVMQASSVEFCTKSFTHLILQSTGSYVQLLWLHEHLTLFPHLLAVITCVRISHHDSSHSMSSACVQACWLCKYTLACHMLMQFLFFVTPFREEVTGPFFEMVQN